MELRTEDWAYLQRRIEEVADVGGELTLKFRNQTMIVKGGITEVREVPIETVDNSNPVNVYRELTKIELYPII